MQKAPFSKILVGIDISDQTPRILEGAQVFSEALGAVIIVCMVANIRTSVQGNEQDGFPANDEEQISIDRIKELVHSVFGSNSGKVEVKILHGDPAERISEYADYLNCDLVIVGSRSKGALKKALLGSVSGSVASRCKKSVLIVR